MRVLILSCLLFVTSLAQTEQGQNAGNSNNWMGAAMAFADGDMYDMGDMFDGDMMPYMMNMGGMGAQAQQQQGGAQQQGMGGMMPPMFGDFGDIGDMMSDVVDNMKDGDIMDVMENLAPLAAMGLPGLDLSQFTQGGMPDMGSIMQGLSPYMMMDGDFGDFGDMFDGDYMEDMMKYGGMMGIPQPWMQQGQQMVQNMMQGQQMQGTQLQKPHLRHRRHRRPSRLLKKTHRAHPKMKLRKPREFPFFMMNAMNQGKSAVNSMLPYFGYDGMDSEDRAAYLMMGGNPNNMPPPLDGIDGEDLWMYRGTKYDPMNWFKKSTSGSTTEGDANADSTSTQQNSRSNNMMNWLPFYWSSLQKPRHMKY